MCRILAIALLFAGGGCGDTTPATLGPTMKYEKKFGAIPLFAPCTEEQLTAFEGELGASLPEDYRAFLMEWNGVYFENEDAAFLLKNSEDDQTDCFVTRLYGLMEAEARYDIRKMQAGYAFNERVPDNILAIGNNSSWCHLCISISGPDRGAIYFWDPGEPWEPDGKNVPTREWMDPVADNFAEFWQIIYARPPYEP